MHQNPHRNIRSSKAFTKTEVICSSTQSCQEPCGSMALPNSPMKKNPGLNPLPHFEYFLKIKPYTRLKLRANSKDSISETHVLVLKKKLQKIRVITNTDHR